MQSESSKKRPKIKKLKGDLLPIKIALLWCIVFFVFTVYSFLPVCDTSFFKGVSSFLPEQLYGGFCEEEAAKYSAFTFPGDLALYHIYSSRIVSGLIPYKDFDLEYPPIALLIFTIPRLFSSTFEDFSFNFTLIAIISQFIILLIIFEISKHIRTGNVYSNAFVYALLVFPLVGLAVSRYDFFPALLTLISIFLFIKQRHSLASIILGVAVMTKVYPILLLPLFLIYHFKKKQNKQIKNSLALFVITVLIISAPFLSIAPRGFLSSFTYHFARPIQIESTYSSIVLLDKILFGSNVDTFITYGSVNVSSHLCPLLLGISSIIIIIIFLAVYCLFYIVNKKGKKGTETDKTDAAIIIAFSLLSIMAFIISSKVFSPQYIIWLCPFIPLIKVNKQVRNSLLLLFVLISVFTYLLFPVMYWELMELKREAIYLLIVRNALTVIGFLSVFWLLSDIEFYLKLKSMIIVVFQNFKK